MVAGIRFGCEATILDPIWSLIQRSGAAGATPEMEIWAPGACLPGMLAILDRIGLATATHRPEGDDAGCY